jgi:hypothetical protein
MSLAKAIYALGVTDNDFNTAIGGIAIQAGRFFPEGTKFKTVPEKPYATYKIITSTNSDLFRLNRELTTIQIKNYSDNVSPSETDEITEKAKQLFHKTKLTVTGATGVMLFRENIISATRDGVLWTSSIDFRTFIQET